MRSAHRGRGITDADWDASVKDLVTTLDKFRVPEKEKGEVLGAISRFERGHRGALARDVQNLGSMGAPLLPDFGGRGDFDGLTPSRILTFMTSRNLQPFGAVVYAERSLGFESKT